MLQRAASNAYSWWWASHIRTKQSKWLEHNLHDMEEKVQNVLKLIEEDGDSFAKRAEMYYKKRPELIHFVEESFRAYRALAERYDHLSTELQNANTTIASVFPEQIQFAMDEDEDEASPPKFPRKPPDVSKGNVPKVPKIPKALKGTLTSAPKKLQPKKSTKIASATSVPKSGLSKSEGLKEIDRLQKQILALQTQKEFAKSSYEVGLAKYWELEEQITEMQQKVCSLQDEFGSGTVIEDDEARTLMASVALKSCQDSLAYLQENQERSAQAAAVEHTRIVNTRERLKSLKDDFFRGHTKEEIPRANGESVEVDELKSLDRGELIKPQQRQDLQLLREKINGHFEVESNSSLTVTELAEKIDELVNKVISLEAEVSSQTGLIVRLRTETDELQAQIRTLEDDKATLINGKNDLSEKLMEMETKLHGLQDLDRSVEDQNGELQMHFNEAHCNLDHLSENVHFIKPDEESRVELQARERCMVELELQEESKGHEGPLSTNDMVEDQMNMKQNVELKVSDDSQQEFTVSKQETSQNHECLQEFQCEKPDEDLAVSGSSLKEEKSLAEVCLLTEAKETKEKPNLTDVSEKAPDMKECDVSITSINLGENMHQPSTCNDCDKQASPKTADEQARTDMQASTETVRERATKQDDEPDWKQLFVNGMENREKILLTEYTKVLRNCKEVKKKLAEEEKKNGDSLFDTMVQLRELKSVNAKKDEHIRVLREKLRLLQVGLRENNESEKSMITESPIKEREITEDFKVILMDRKETISEIEEKFRSSIDQVLEENLEFWLRFSTTFHQIQKFESEVKDLQSELSKLEENQRKQDWSSTEKYALKSDAKPIYKHLREIRAELMVWLEKSMSLKEELNTRFTSLCDIQEEITAALKASAEDDDFKFTSHQAAKFQGEVLNMKQENNKVADELQAGLDHITMLQLDVDKTLEKLDEEFMLLGSRNKKNIQIQHPESRPRIPLSSFIFGNKPKRQKHSIFACVHPALHLHRKYN